MNADKKSVVQLVAIQKCSPSLSLSPSLSADISHSPFSPVHTHTRIIQKYIYVCVYIICVCVCACILLAIGRFVLARQLPLRISRDSQASECIPSGTRAHSRWLEICALLAKLLRGKRHKSGGRPCLTWR